LLKAVGEDPGREGLRKTPDRIARMYKELTAGYSITPEALINGALFESQYDEMVVVKGIEFYSLCEHHLLPFFGNCHIAYIPSGRIIGLSKIPRIVDAYARRVQIQERLTWQIADFVNTALRPMGTAVSMEAEHLCMMMRGVKKANAKMVTNSMLGCFKRDERTRNEFMSLIRSGNGG
jgi:GTP cyclohydrolase I